MIFAMIFAHLAGDYLLQWDSLAAWKSRDVRGVAVHSLIVTLVTLILANWVDSRWWPWALFIGVAHLGIDTARFCLQRRLPRRGLFSLGAFCLDQTAHGAVMALALFRSGVMPLSLFSAEWLSWLQHHALGLTLLTYLFISLPAWVLIEFLSYGLAQGSEPNFAEAAQGKFVGILERGLMLTSVWQGYALLMPLVVLPRLLIEHSAARPLDVQRLTVTRILVSMSLTLLAGLALQCLTG